MRTYTSRKGEKTTNHTVTSEASSSKTMRFTSDMTSWTATSNISSAVQRRNASKWSPKMEGNATLTRTFVEDAFATIHKFMWRQWLFVHRLRLRFEKTSGSTIRPIGVENSLYFAMKRTVSKNLHVLLRITLKFSKKAFRIRISALINMPFLGPKVYE